MKIVYWNVRHINLAKVEDPKLLDKIVAVLGQGDICFILENKTLPEEVVQALVGRLKGYGTYQGKGQYCGGYQSTYENTIILWNTATVATCDIEVRDFKGDIVPSDAKPSTFTSSTRLLTIATLQNRLRVAAVHLPGPGTYDNSIFITQIRKLMATIKPHLVGGDWNHPPSDGDYGGAEWVGPKEKDGTTPAATTYNNKLQLASAYDWLLINTYLLRTKTTRSPFAVTAMQGWADNETAWKVSDHLPVIVEIKSVESVFTL